MSAFTVPHFYIVRFRYGLLLVLSRNFARINKKTMRKLVFTCAVLVLLVSSFSGSVFGWNDVGHKITAYLAWQRMSPVAREAVIKILRAAPEDSHLSAFYM